MRKFGRKCTSALLALALLVSLLPLGAAPAQAEGLTIKINSGSDLLYFIRDLGSGNEGYADANVVLTANISVGDFFPVGYYAPQSPVVPFTGTFDGNGHTISGNLVGIDNENFPVNKVGIIAVLGSAGIVKNLNVTCSVSGRVDGNVGGIVGENNGGTVTNCTFSGSVSAVETSAALWGRTMAAALQTAPTAAASAAKATSAALWGRTAALAPELPAATTPANSSITFLSVLLTAISAASLGITLTTAVLRTATTPHHRK